MEAPLALYRRYRPDTFDDVIGQDHVSEPLSQALDNNRVNHAYLFSGPRGCGKTTCARIMARALNCEKGVTSTPCGVCDSCVELARGGPGSLDVIEIDAATHNGVDDARDLRERAFFAPMKSRYKVYIIDEAHMVTPAAFNALLKLVEEPPAHLRFIFATTEPDKVIATIRSRTHHYPFRLVPPKVLGDYLVHLCHEEGVDIEPTVVPLIVRAGAGSVRDSLSVLDQLIGGSGPIGVTYQLATSLLGYTPASLLDETVDALAADDGATLFGVVEKVVDTGQDPRRFAEDLLHRLRDLVVVSAVPNAASRGLIEVSDDQADRLAGQAQRFGRAELTRAADIVSQGLTDMRGATAPRLLLEMMCARILLPGLDQSAEGLGARLDRVERRLSVVGDVGASRRGGTSPAAPRAAVGPTGTAADGGPPAELAAPLDDSPPRGLQAPTATTEIVSSTASPSTQHPAHESAEEPAGRLEEDAIADSTVATAAAADLRSGGAEAPAASGELSLVDVRQLWPGVLLRVEKMRRFAWAMLRDNAQVKDVRDGTITIAFVNAGARDRFLGSGNHDILRQSLIDELGVDWTVEAIVDEAADPGGSRTPRPTQPAPVRLPRTDQPPATSSPGAEPAVRTAQVGEAKAAIRPTRGGGGNASGESEVPRTEDVADDDDVIDDASLTSQELLSRELGAEVIADIRHDTSH